MSNLIPESRADKNGHVVTRWVKSDRSGDEASSLPGPSAVPPVGYRISEFIRKSYQSHWSYFPPTLNFNDIERRLLKIPKVTLDLIMETLSGGDDEGLYFAQVIISALDKELSPKVIDDMSYLYSQLDDEAIDSIAAYGGWTEKGFEGTEVIRDHLAGCAQMTTPSFNYDYEGKQPVRLMGDNTASQILALYNVVGYISEEVTGDHLTHDAHAGATWLKDEKLTELIVRNHERAPEIIELMSERETLDPEVLSLVLEDHHHALGEGAL